MVTNVGELLGAEERDEVKLRQRKNALKSKLQTLQTLDDEILALTAEDAIEEEVLHADEARERIELAIIQLSDVLGASRPS